MKKGILLPSLLAGVVFFLVIVDGKASNTGKTSIALTDLDKQVLDLPYYRLDSEKGKPVLGSARTYSPASDAARRAAQSASLQEQSARHAMARAESVMTSRASDSAQKNRAQIDYDNAKRSAESARRTREEQEREASKQAMYAKQDAERCNGYVRDLDNSISAISSANKRARSLFAAGDFMGALSALEEVKIAQAALNGTRRAAIGCENFPRNIKTHGIGNLMLEAQALRHTKGESVAGERILWLYLQTLADTERSDASQIIWKVYSESVRILSQDFGGRHTFQKKLRLPIEGVEFGRTIGKKDMERLEFDLFQGFKRDVPLPVRFDYARRFAKSHVEERNAVFFEDAVRHLENPSRSNRSNSVFPDDQLFYYVACYYEFSGRSSEVPNIFRAYETFVDAKKDPVIYRGFADYREMKSRMDRFLAAAHLSLPATSPLKWGLDTSKVKRLEEKKRLENLKKQPGMRF